MATFLELAQRIADEVGVDRPTALVGSTQDTAQRFLALFKREGFDLIHNYELQELVKYYSFPTVVAQQDYAFPTDYTFFKNITGWNSTKRFQLNGPLTPREWNNITQYNTNSSYTYFFRIQNKKVSLYPIPSTIENISFEYQSKEWVISALNVRQQDILLDTDSPYIDNEIVALGLKWLYLKSVGLPYEDDFNMYKDYLKELNMKQFMGRELYTDNWTGPFVAVIPETIPVP